MESPPGPTGLTRALDVLNQLVFPILMFLLGGFLILHDSTSPPPGIQWQGEAGLGALIVIAATGRGLDVLDRIRGKGGS